MPQDVRKYMLIETMPLLEALRVIDETKGQIALVHENGHLLGTLTDGDIRRAILSGINLDTPVGAIMNHSPTIAPAGTSRQGALRLMQKHSIHQLPIVDSQGLIVDILLIDALLQPATNDNWVVLMAGGLGSRLKPLTDDLPKPLIQVGDKPILETILLGFLAAGFTRFYISVNYKAEMIESYFGDGTKWGVEIRYIREQKRLGTAGALALLPERPTKPFFVMNGDLLTTVNFTQMLMYHTEHKTVATMCVREHAVTIPYGVVAFDEHRFMSIREKPTERFFVNAGVYIIDPAVLSLLAPEEEIDMPSLFDRVVQAGDEASVFPLREYWIDVGRLDDLKRASDEYERVFG